MRQTIDAKEATRRLGVTLRTLQRWRDAGRIHEAPRDGRNMRFYADEVAALAGGKPVRPMSIAEVYMRLCDVQTWEELDALKEEMGEAVCAAAEDVSELEESYRAACLMAAHNPDPEAAGRWMGKAVRWGGLLGMADEDVRKAVDLMGTEWRYGSFEEARERAARAEADPIAAIARREFDTEHR